MAQIPTLQRQRGLPRSTGVPAMQAVQLADPVGKALGSVAQTFDAIETQLFKAEAAGQLNAGMVNAQLKLSALEAEPNVGEANDLDDRIQLIQDEASAGMGPMVLEQFQNKFDILQAKSRISIKSTIIKKRFKALEAGLIIGLDALARGIGPAGKPINSKDALLTGFKGINDAINTGVTDAVKGAKLKLKFRSDVAEQSVTGWINSQAPETLLDTYTQMANQKFNDPNIALMWGVLGEKTKAKLTAQAITNVARWNSFQDAAERRADDVLKTNALDLQRKYYKSKDREERGRILEELAKNSQTSLSVYNMMLKDYEGRTDRFDDPKVETALRLKIMQTPHLVTDKEIIESNLSNVDELLTMHGQRITGRLARAREIITVDKVFLPATYNERLMKGDAFDYMQAEIWGKVLREQTDHRDRGKPFDPVARAQELIKEFTKEEDADDLIKVNAARAQLKTRGIYEEKDVHTYINKNAGELTQGQMDQIYSWGKKVFK